MAHHNQCPSCGDYNSLTPFTGESRTFAHGDYYSSTIHGLVGERCSNCNETIYDPDSYVRVLAEVDALACHRKGVKLRYIRESVLNLTRREAAILLTGGDVGTITVYESGAAEPPKALLTLMLLLEEKPELIDNIRKLKASW